jgi:hypothetical protein
MGRRDCGEDFPRIWKTEFIIMYHVLFLEYTRDASTRPAGFARQLFCRAASFAPAAPVSWLGYTPAHIAREFSQTRTIYPG